MTTIFNFKYKTFLSKLSILLILFFLVVVNFSFAQEHSEQKGDDETLNIIEKVIDHPFVDFYFLGKLHLPHFPPVHIFGMTIDFSITKSLFMMMLASLLLILVLKKAASSNTKNPVPKGIGNIVESIVVFVRDDMVKPNIGDTEESEKLLPFFLTLFFFILFANLLGLIPFMAQPTKNINVTAALALITFMMTQIKGIQKNGFLGYFKGLVPSGVPVFVLPVMIVVEFIGLLAKPFALLIRLFANITAGSIMVISLIGFVFIFQYAGAVITIPFGIFIYLLEIFVSFLQAFIFTLLSILFISMAMHQEH